MFRLIAINFSQKSPHFSLLSPTSPCELSERQVTSPSNLKVVGALVYILDVISSLPFFFTEYRILGKKGEGTFSEVLKCQHIKDGTYWACKKMKQTYER